MNEHLAIENAKSRNTAGVFAICESNRQVDWLFDHHQLLRTVDHLVAANPDAVWALQRRGAVYLCLEDYDRRKTPEQIERLLAEQIQWAHRVDAFLQDAISQFKVIDFCPARYCLYYLKIGWDTFIHRVSILQQLATAARPDEILFFANPKPMTFDDRFLLNGSALAELIPDWAEHYRIRQRMIPSLEGDTFWGRQVYTHSGSRIRRTLSRLLPGKLYTTLYRVYQRTFRQLGNLPSSFDHQLSAAHPRLICRKHYDLNQSICNQLQARGMALLSFEGALAEAKTLAPSAGEIEPAISKVWESVVSRPSFWQPGGWQNWSIRNVLEPLFHQFWFQSIPDLWTSMTGAIAMIERKQPKAIVVGITPRLPDIGLIMAARKVQVPIVYYQHGVFMGEVEHPIWDVTDRYYSDYMLVYGTGEVRYIQGRPHHNEVNATPIAVGSARLDDVRRKGTPDLAQSLRRRVVGTSPAPLILYVPDMFKNNVFRFSGRDLQPDISLFELRKQIARLFNNHPNIHFVYKAFASMGNDPTLEMLSTFCPKCIIIDDIRLTDLQWAADVLIHEIPSTGMVEGLLTDKPMIVYVNRDVLRMKPEAREMLGKRVVLTETGDEFVHSIETLVAQGDYAAISNPNQEYLQTYVTHLNDGQSASRATEAIHQIVIGGQSST